MKRLLFLFSISLFLGLLAVHFTIYTAHADDATTVKGSKSNTSERQVEPAPAPEPVEATTVKSSKSNSQDLQVQPEPAPDPVEATTVKSSKSNSDNRQVEPAPAPEPVEATTVKSSKSNSSEWIRAGGYMTDEATDGSGAAADETTPGDEMQDEATQ